MSKENEIQTHSSKLVMLVIYLVVFGDKTRELLEHIVAR